jgi:hypothetical protein
MAASIRPDRSALPVAQTPPDLERLSGKEATISDSPVSSDASSASEQDLSDARAVRKKVDHRLLAFYCIVYLFMRINATNATNTGKPR